MVGSREGSSMLRMIMIGLYSLLVLSLVQSGIVLQLYAARNVDATMSLSLILSFVSSQISLIFVFLHSLLARRHRLAVMYNRPGSRLNSICRLLPRILIMGWMLAAAAGLIVAARQPRCMMGHALQNFWQFGVSCQLHRAVVGMSVVAFVSVCTVFCCIEVSNCPYQASLSGILEPDRGETPCLKQSVSELSWSSTSSSDSVKREKLYYYRPTDLESLSSDRARWIQRRDSVSSQSAIYPPNLRYSSTGCLPPPTFFQLNRSPSAFLPQIPYSPSHRSNSSSSTTTSLPSAFGSFYNYLPQARTGSPGSSVSRSTSSTSTRKSPLSTMRRASEPEVPVIPAKFLDTKDKPGLQRSPTLPCSWSPSLSHPPLSADPAIRAFSTEDETHPERPSLKCAHGRKVSSISGLRLVEPSLDLNLSPHQATSPPELPARARGHSIPSNIASTHSISAHAHPPTVTYSTRPRISRMPTSSALASIYIPRTRPSLISSQNVNRPQLVHQASSTDSNRTVSSNLSRVFATPGVLEAQKVKRRWELARSREASAYSMGGWGSAPEGGRERITSLRQARGRGREKKRACT